MLRSHLPTTVLACSLLLTPTGCDRVEGLLSKGDAAPEAKADAKASAAEEASPAEATPSPEEAPADEAEPEAAEPDAAEPDAAEPDAAEPDGPSKTNALAGVLGAQVAAASTALAEGEAAADQPCIVGRWDAIEYTAAVRRAINKDPQLRSLKKTSSGGHITYVVDPPTGDGGAIRATADHLKYGFRGKVQGVGVTLNLDIHGDTEATYELEGSDRIVVAKPTTNTMKVKAKAKIEGFGSHRKADKVDLDFDGSFTYECSDDTLRVWRGSRGGRGMEFRRGTEPS